MKQMRIACWTKTVYSDDSSINESLRGRDFSPGKHYVRANNEMHEIDVNAPNVDESEFCKFNVCPVGTIGVEEACLQDATIIKPIDKIKKTEVMRTDENGHPVKARMVGKEMVDYLGNPVTKIIEEKIKGCPSEYILGERTDAIKWLGKKKPMATAGIVADAADENLEVMEPRTAEGAELELSTSLTCVKIQPLPLEKKWVEMITDSIIGWGGYSEFPFWEMNWDLMNTIAEKRSRWTGDYMARNAEIEEGFRYCWNDYNNYPCACFKKKEEAEDFKKSIQYYDFSNEFEKDTREFLEDEFIENKINELYPRQQKTLVENKPEDRTKLFGKIRKKYKEEMAEEVTDERMQERMDFEKQDFFDDLAYQFESIFGWGEKSFGEEPVQFCWLRKGKTEKNTIVLVKEDL